MDDSTSSFLAGMFIGLVASVIFLLTIGWGIDKHATEVTLKNTIPCMLDAGLSKQIVAGDNSRETWICSDGKWTRLE